MWFRNLQIYRLPSGLDITAERLEAQLAEHVFRSCGSMEMHSSGWLPPRGDERLAYALHGQLMLALGVEHKLLPSSVINEFAKERIAEFEQQQGYNPSRKQAREIKEQVAEELLPRAFARRRATFVWIDPVHGWLVVDAASAAKAEEVLEMLSKSVSDLQFSLLRTELSPATAMTEWLTTGEAPSGFSIDRECELRSPVEENATVRYVRHALDAEEISAHIVAGKQPTRLALTWDDRISFVLTDKMEVKRLAFLDILKEEAEASAETADEQFDADFTLMTGELSRMIPALLAVLGGEQAPSI